MSNSNGFASDNHSGVHPNIMEALVNANIDYTMAYGYDEFTKKSIKKFKEHFGNKIEVFYVYNGTAANVLGLKTVTNSFNSIICPKTSHLNVHECCAPEKFTGCKITTVDTKDGKLTIDRIVNDIKGFDDEHCAQPKIISITQPTELGTIYSINELKKLTRFAHENNLLVHVDGARLCNAAAGLNVGLRDISTDVNIDSLSFGGTKNGMMFGDAVIFFNKNLSKNFKYFRKQGMQLASKMRFIAVQFEVLLTNNLWLKNAKHSNDMAQLLYKQIKNISQIQITQKVETNAIFSILPSNKIKTLQKKYFFHIFDKNRSEVRWMCSFNTSIDDVKEFVSFIRKILL